MTTPVVPVSLGSSLAYVGNIAFVKGIPVFCGKNTLGVGSTLTPVSTATFLTSATSSGNLPKAPATASITPPNTSPNKLLTKPPACSFMPSVLALSAAICSAFNKPEFKSLVAPNSAFLSWCAIAAIGNIASGPINKVAALAKVLPTPTKVDDLSMYSS